MHLQCSLNKSIKQPSQIQQKSNQQQNKNVKLQNFTCQKRLISNVKTQQRQNQSQKKKEQIQNVKNTKAKNLTYRSYINKSLHHTNQLILVYLMYKDQKLSLFLNKGVQFQELLRRMYKQIYIYQKQTYSISNAILKNLLHKITGFQSIDNDLFYDYELKYKRGKLQNQKFFVPFKQEDMKMPFKIYCKIQENGYGGSQFLVRNYSDGQWCILTSIKKHNLEQQKINSIKKSLKSNFLACNFLIKLSQSNFSQINWFETKNHLFILSQFFPENLEENLKKNVGIYDQQDIQKTYIFSVKWLACIFKCMVQSNVQIFKKLSLQDIGLNSLDGYPRVNLIQNVTNCIEFTQKRRSLIQNGKRISEKINDKFYQSTFIFLLKSLKTLLISGYSQKKLLQQKLNQVLQISSQQKFNFDDIIKHELLCEMNLTCGMSKKPINPLKVDYQKKILKIVQKMNETKTSQLNHNATIVLSQLKEQIQRFFGMQNIRKNQQRNQNRTVLQLITHLNGLEINKQNIGNISQFKKQQERKFQLKTKQKIYIKEIINELNQNQNFIKTTKQNNLASLEFYLKKSDQKIKKKMIHKIETKYKKFLEKKSTSPDQQTEFNQRNHSINSFSVDAVKFQNSFEYKSTQKQQKNSERLSVNFIKNNLIPIDEKLLKNNMSLIEDGPKKASSMLFTSLNQNQNILSKNLSNLSQKHQVYRFKTYEAKTKQNSLLNLKLKKKLGKFQQSFVNRVDYPKSQKLQLKKKQYGIYLQQAEKQYNKIKMYRKNVVTPAK